ncbi:MAG: PAS domain S-box protein [Candidatus Cloacimonetes bacterium]|jgi:PAS domain S-box-containing protein|nr:PAS domain S-box protein [Candidatus Cloacimonadota bacterium]MBT6994404.1 PAS domain S-box protein [Candidatus Cloacimonadota bacterium]MBT7469573.1 PAS domain S-box protein [Candidatus Cloacimonadota bacterium]
MKNRIRFLAFIILLISLFQTVYFLVNMELFTDLNLLKLNFQNTIIITFFAQFIFILLLFFYLPISLKKSFSNTKNLLKDIGKGLYSIEINLDEKRKDEFYELSETIAETLQSIQIFDKLKKDKVMEHHQRINAILNLSDNGFIILDLNGNIIYINDPVLETFANIQEKTNLLNTNFPPEIENNIKKYAIKILQTQTKQDAHQFFLPNLKRHIVINGKIIRNLDGAATGAILALTNIQKKKQEKEVE